MPTYLFLNNETGEEFTEFMMISQLDDYLKENPNLTQQVYGAPMIGTNILVGRSSKPENGFRDVLREIKKKNSRGLTRSTVNTF
jgi:hypothetical protein